MPTEPDNYTEIDLLSLPSPGLVKRLMSITYDTLVLAGMSLVYGMIGLTVKELIYGEIPAGVTPKGGPVLFAGWVFVLLGFYLFFWHRAGQTVGMRAWRLKVVNTNSANGTKPTTLQNLLRCLLAIMSFFCFGIGYFWCLFDPEKNTLHEKLSNTRTVALPKKTANKN